MLIIVVSYFANIITPQNFLAAMRRDTCSYISVKYRAFSNKNVSYSNTENIDDSHFVNIILINNTT